ncbi:MAG: 2-hydroxyacyl-CoA dehydratase family protein, partial [Rhodospirillales bacterium]|nr:2-hydroxyacyl-CoA dehydratase family protein [Rhodospirillales bacterium]
MTASAPLFDGWQDQPLDKIIARCRDLVEDETYPTVKAWRRNGGKVVGHFQVYFPEELVHAAGMLPLKIRGGQTDDTSSGSQHFGSYLCSILKTSLDLAIEKNIELDLFVSHPICDGARNLAGIWGRNFPYKCQILHLPQNPNSKSAAEFLRNEYLRLADDIEAAGGNKLTDEALRNSLGVYNRSRRLMRQIYAIRRATPWKLSADESLALISVAGFLPRQEFIDMLEAVIPMIEARQVRPKDKMRIVFEGGFCEVPPFDLLQAVSRSSYVVDD